MNLLPIMHTHTHIRIYARTVAEETSILHFFDFYDFTRELLVLFLSALNISRVFPSIVDLMADDGEAGALLTRSF